MSLELKQPNAIAMDTPPPVGGVTFEEFLLRDGEFIEWVDGEIIEMSPVSNDHQRLLRFLVNCLSEYVETHALGEILFAPSAMRLNNRPSAREPDLMFVRTDRSEIVRENYVDGAADLAVEIISPESGQRDRFEKFDEYARGGVREYWLLDPANASFEFYTLQVEGIYHPVALEVGGIYRSIAIPGLWIKTEWLLRRPLPSAASIRREWGI